MPQVVPMQVDVAKPLLTVRREILVGALAPERVYTVRLEHGHAAARIDSRRSRQPDCRHSRRVLDRSASRAIPDQN